jgi:hypothetical protein
MSTGHKLRRLALAALATALIGPLVSCGGGGGGSAAAPGGGTGGNVDTTISGLVWNSPVDGAPIRATCADGSAGGNTVASLGTYSITVTCAPSNYPIVIAISGDGALSGPDFQFGTVDDYAYRLSERAPLKAAVESSSSTIANLTALSTVAAQPIEDRIAAYKSAPIVASRPTAADVQSAERNAAFAFGMKSTDVLRANPLTDPQLARVLAQFSEAIGAIKSLSVVSVSPEDVLKSFAQAAQLGGSGGSGSAGQLVKLEADGLYSLDLAEIERALNTAESSVKPDSLGATAAQMALTRTTLADAKIVASSLKSIGFELERVVRGISTAPAIQSFDASRANVSTLASEIRNLLASPTNSSGSTGALTARTVSESLRRAGAKVQEIETSSTLSANERVFRKRAVFSASEAIRSAVEYEIIVKSAVTPLTGDDVARFIAQTSIATELAGEMMKTAAIENVVDIVTGRPRLATVGIAERICLDVGQLLTNKSKADLGDLRAITAQSVIGSGASASIVASANNLSILLAPIRLDASIGDSAARFAVSAVGYSIANTTYSATASENIRATISYLASSLNASNGQKVTVGAAIDVAVDELPEDTQSRLYALAAHTIIGLAKLDYTSSPTIPAANSAVTSAAAMLTKALVIAKLQTIVIGEAPNIIVGGSGLVSATGGPSGNPVRFNSESLQVCSVLGNIVVGLSVGTCVIAADQAGSAEYLPASKVVQSFTVGKGSQEITFDAPPSIFPGASGTLNARGGGSGSLISYASTTTSICTVNGSSVTGISAGTCQVSANQIGNANYNAAPQTTQSIIVARAPQIITFGIAPTMVVGTTGQVSARGGGSGNAIIFSSTTTAICTVAGDRVTGVSPGNCVVAANQAGSENYNAAVQATQSILLGLRIQNIGFGPAPNLVVGGTVIATANGGGSGSPIVFDSGTPLTCTVSGNVIFGVAAGNCVLIANQAGSTSFAPAPQATQNITVGRSGQSIVFGSAPSIAVGNAAVLAAIGGPSGNAVTFASATPAICTVSGSTVSGLGVGICVITADQGGNENYLPAAQVTQTIQVAAGGSTFAGVCQIRFSTAVAYVTGAPDASTCVNSLLNIDGFGATVTVGPSNPIAGKIALPLAALSTCDAFGTPPSPGAETLTPCKR